MWKSLTGIAAAAMLAAVAAPSPANAAPIQNAPGLSEAQIGAEQVQRRRRAWRGGPRYWRGGPRYYRAYPYRAYPGPYVYAPGPYYYRPYYGPPGPFVQFGPFGFGIW